jgi:lipopolysaccharide/colanic/teichoic acid biosynthesis glycosyltransferase
MGKTKPQGGSWGDWKLDLWKNPRIEQVRSCFYYLCLITYEDKAKQIWEKALSENHGSSIHNSYENYSHESKAVLDTALFFNAMTPSSHKAPSQKMTRPAEIPRWKRTLDVVFILLTLPFVLPLAVCVAVLIRMVSAGPVLFRQERVGYMGRKFMCFKFRTMFVGAETTTHQGHLQQLMKSDAPMVKLDARGDSRIIPFGLLLRSSGLDELPQLINVLRGEMSMVGPRPCLPYESDDYLPWQRERFNTLPGLTGLWQVSGKNRTTFAEMMQLDISYARKKTLWMDLAIILKTIPAILGQVWQARKRKKALLLESRAPQPY